MKKTVVPRASRVGALPLNTQPSTTDSSFRLSIRLSMRSSLRLSLRLCVDPRVALRKVRDPLWRRECYFFYLLSPAPITTTVF